MSDEHDPRRPSTWTRVERLFHDALELGGDAREALLARAEQDEPKVAAEVRSLLAAHDDSGGMLDEPAWPPPADALAAGESVGPYRLVAPIGRGGMGVVWRARRDDEHFTKDVAIKLIDPGVRTEDILRRFRAERQILAMLEHPHIARLLDGGGDPRLGPYLVMEYVDGRPLLPWCDEHQLDVEARIAIFLTVCDAVQFAHQRLVVHRDLKSDNVLVGADGSPRLLDFGIAKLLAPDGDGADSTLTAPLQRRLTPDYASPEQLRGEPATVASDVYSLGVVLYELLTGARPHRFTTRSPEEIQRILSSEDAAPPSTMVARNTDDTSARMRGATTARLRRRLAGDLDVVVLKALEKDPSRRYATVEQFAEDLRRHQRGLPVRARGRARLYRASRFVRRNRAAIVAGALVAASLVAGLAATAWQARVARQERDVARRRFQDVRALAHAVVYDIHDAIAPLEGSTPAREALVRHALVYLDGLAKEAKDDHGLERELANAYMRIGDVQGRPLFANLGHPADALKSYERAAALIASAAVAFPDSLKIQHERIVIAQRRADMFGVLGRPRDAIAESRRARELAAEQIRRHPGDRVFLHDFSICCSRLADLRLAAADTLGALEEQRADYAIAAALYHEKPGDPVWRRGMMINDTKLANLHGMLGHRDSADVLYREAETLCREAIAASPNESEPKRDYSVLAGFHALYLSSVGETDAALAIYMSGQRYTDELAAADPENMLLQSDVASSLHERGQILAEGGRWSEALDHYERAYDAFARLLARDSANAEARTFRGRSAQAAGDACVRLSRAADGARWRERAITWYERALALFRPLARAGALEGEDAAAPAQVERALAKLRTGGG